MASVHEQLSDQFFKWESRGRGWQVFDDPVYPEPPFRPFPGHHLPEAPAIDDGRRATFLSSLFRKPPPPPAVEVEEEPEPQILIRDSLVELQTSLPADLNIPKEAFDQFLSNLSLCQEPIAFELLGVHQRVVAQFALHEADAPLARRQLQAYFPEAVFQPQAGALKRAWDTAEGDEILAVEFGLEREFMFPLACGKLDPFIGIIGALSELQPTELGLFQVLFQPVQDKWADSITRAVTHADGKPFFVNAPELAGAAEKKIARPLYAAVVRIMVRTEDYDRTVQIARDLAASLRVFINPQGNALVPLTNDDYPFEDHITDVLSRQSRRSGMLLNADELMGFVHLPSGEVRSPVLQREAGKIKAAPKSATGRQEGLLLGFNSHAGITNEVRLSPDERSRHTHIIGASGSGKSTLLLNLIRQSIDNGEGVALLDPHGDLVDAVLGMIPEHRIGDVVLLDPADETHAVGFNILSAHTELEKTLLASDLVSVFQRLSTSWGDQMGSVLQNAILAFLESREGGTLMELRRFLLEPDFQKRFLQTVDDSEVLYYWHKGFPQLQGKKSIGSILTRLDTFLAPKPIRHMVSQRENRLDFANIMDTGKIFLAKLAQGQIGKENSFLLGSLLVGKFQETAMSRQAQAAATRRPFTLAADEFHNFITPSMAEILTGARKYRLGLILAHQELRQLEREREVASAVLANAYTRVCFRLGDDDARKLADGFSSFDSRDLQNLNPGQAICRLERSDGDFNLTVPLPENPDAEFAAEMRQRVITVSREKYSRPRADVEAELRQRLELTAEKPTAKHKPASEKQKVEVPQMATATPEAPPPALPAPPATPAPEVPKPRMPPKDLGRGGAQHKAIQQRLKEGAEMLGFRSTIEKPVLDGKGSVDLLLERGGDSIAVEISFSTTIDHEFGNVDKCVKAGYRFIAVVSSDDKRLRDIEAAVTNGLGKESGATVMYLKPDGLLDYLRNLPAVPASSAPAESTVRGFKVRRHVAKLSPEEQKQREDAAVQMLGESMKKRPRKN